MLTLEKCTSTGDALHKSNTELLYSIGDQMHILRFELNTVKLRFASFEFTFFLNLRYKFIVFTERPCDQC
jgi:hypothetical protein